MKKNITNLKELNIAISKVHDIFTKQISKKLNLIKVPGPLFLEKNLRINDNLSENKNAVTFRPINLNKEIEIVQSLAKWKRLALKKYDFKTYEGLVVDMKAIRPHETLDEIHSLLVEQWDWEIIIKDKDRNIKFLKEIINKIYSAILNLEKEINKIYNLTEKLPKKITFFDSQEIEDKYGSDNFENTTKKLTKKYGAIFIFRIGDKLKSGRIFDSRSTEYDDWQLNGDLFLYSPITKQVMEISSMGIRVNRDSLINQTKIDVNSNDLSEYYKLIINNKLPQTIGGGIGVSRLTMFVLEKKHIGEVQCSVWDFSKSTNKKINLL